MTEHALLLMGGIGDFLHYLTRLPAFLSEKRFEPSDVHIFVESVIPDRAEAIFTRAFPQLSFTFLSSTIHWANTFPLLTPSRALDRINRPAYRYVQSLGFEQITDWFLPFLCAQYEFDVSPLSQVIGGIPKRDRPYVIISARDKGFIWWPTRQLCDEVHQIITMTREAIYVGMPNEQLPGGGKLEAGVGILEALALSYHADLYVGTDTGVATFRELTGKRNIYCVSRFWIDGVMTKYGYFDDEMRRRTSSIFAFSREELLMKLAADLGCAKPSF